METTRRDWLATLAAMGLLPTTEEAAYAQDSDLETVVVKRHDASVESLLERQITDSKHEHYGGVLDALGLFYPGTVTGLCNAFNAAFHHPKSKFHKNRLMIERLKLAADCVTRSMTPDGNIDLPTTNFNSPPDTAFATLNMAEAASIARKHGTREVELILQPYHDRAKRALLKGGVHTPNHRWVVSSALAMINDLYPDPALVARIDQWLAEGIDIDADGQYDERSIIGYNIIVNRALITMASRLKRPALLEHVRRNLDAAFYLMHPNNEMVTEISHRQDRNTRGDIGVYWFAMHYLAVHDNNPRYAWVARKYAQQRAGLSLLLDYPELLKPLPAPQEPATSYQKDFKALEVARIRRNHKSATLLLRGDNRFLHLRSGDAVINAVRFASAFFGKAQFVPQQWSKQGDNTYILRQSLSGPYYQPLDPPHRVQAGEWNQMRPERQRTEVCFLEQTATITETEKGFSVTLQATGTDKVPVAVEINIRGGEGLQLDGLIRAPQVDDAFLLPTGFATVRVGNHSIRFGPGKQTHLYTQIRGADQKMAGGSVYLTGLTPFRHTIEFECL